MPNMKTFRLCLLCCLSAVLCRSGENLLKREGWTFLPVADAKGERLSLADGTVELSKTSPDGHIFYHFIPGDLKMEPGQEYLVEADYECLDSGVQGLLMVSMPGSARTPYPTSRPLSGVGRPLHAAVTFRAKVDETKIRIHFCLKGQGRVRLTSVTARPWQSPVNMLENPALDWAVRTPLNAEGSMKRDGHAFVITKTGTKGYLAFVQVPDIPITPGKSYRIEMNVTRLDETATSSMMVSMPGGKRTPYPTVAAMAAVEEAETLEYIFTAREDETLLRPHLLINGEGRVRIDGFILEELSVKRLHELENARKARQHSFDVSALRRYFRPFSQLRARLERGALAMDGAVNSGFSCESLSWHASDIQMLWVRFASEAGGYLRMDFTSQYGGDTHSSMLTCSSYPDGEWHDLVFFVGKDPVWKGEIISIKLTWIGGVGRRAIAALEALPTPNAIPFAVALPTGKPVILEHISPRGNYTLRWQGGDNPGCTLTFLDRNGNTLAVNQLPPGEERLTLTCPELAVTAKIVRNDGAGCPVLTLDSLPPLDPPDTYWHGCWIWSQSVPGPINTTVWFERDFTLESLPAIAEYVGVGDDSFELHLNGQVFSGGDDWSTPVRIPVARALRVGYNRMMVKVHNIGAWGGMLGELYMENGDVSRLIVSDGRWTCYVGGETPPEKCDQEVVVLGAPPVAPWNARVGYLYVGPRGQVRITATRPGGCTLTVLKSPTVSTSHLPFRLSMPDGTSRLFTAQVTPATNVWKTGENVELSYRLPPCPPGTQAYLAADFLHVEGDADVGAPPIAEPPNGQLATAKVEGTGQRAWFVIDGQKVPPMYLDFPGGYLDNPAARRYLLDNAKAMGCRLVRFLGGRFDDIWKAPGKYDFTLLDRSLEYLEINAPRMKAIVIIQCATPRWWMNAHPNEVTAYADGHPIHPQKDRQSLASKKWLEDGGEVLRAIIRHIKCSPYSNLVIGMGISEGWNSEWFWPYQDGHGNPARAGVALADYATFRSYLREKYHNDEALSVAWRQPGLTFETIRMPSPDEQDAGRIGQLLDPEQDMRLIDWFAFRNRSIAEAIEHFGKVVKEETGERWMCGAYYGYLIAFSNIYHRLQTVGHLGIEQIARSPYIDYVWGPSYYSWRFMGMGDSPMQPADAFSLHGKLVIVEHDQRTFTEDSHYEARNGRLNTPAQSLGAINRAFGMSLARGIGLHWMEMYEHWFREKVIIDQLAEHQRIYNCLPPVKGTTPAEICVVSDTLSALYTRHNDGHGLHIGLTGLLSRQLPELGAPFRHLLLADLLQPGLVPPHRLYIMTNTLVLSLDQRRTLLARFAREKATVLWMYAPAPFLPGQGPSAKIAGEWLGLEMRLEDKQKSPMLHLIAELGDGLVSSPNATGPWFFPLGGYEQTLGSIDGQPAFVSWQRAGVRHYFCTLTLLPPTILRRIAAAAGVHLYSDDGKDQFHIGNDVLFLHAHSGGAKRLHPWPGTRLRAILGPQSGQVFQNNDSFMATAGQTYGFIAE